MSRLDAAIVLAFVVYAVASGFRARSLASKNLGEYFLAGRSLRGWQAGISMAATQFAADTPLLVTGMIATLGVYSLWRLWIYALAFLLLGFLLAPSWRRAGVLTDAELSELRYAGRAASVLRVFKAFYFGTVFNCVVLAMVLFAARTVVEPFLLWHRFLPDSLYQVPLGIIESTGIEFTSGVASSLPTAIASTNNVLSIAAIIGVTTLYSATGGLRSVVRTDLVQFAVMMAATVVYAWVVVDQVGGLSQLAVRLQQTLTSAPSLTLSADQVLDVTPSRAKDAGFAMLAVIGLQWLVQMNADGTGYLAQRTMACRTDEDATQAALIFTVAQILVRSLLWLPIGVGLIILVPPAVDIASDQLVHDREASFVVGMKQLLPAGALGLMVTAMLAALASTIDTHLNWGASYWANDIYRRAMLLRGREPSGRSLVWVARAANLGLLLVALYVMTLLSSIQVAWQISLLLGAGMGGLLVLRWVWWRITAKGELAAIISSTLLAPLLVVGFPELSDAWRLLITAIVSTGAGIAASYAFGPEPVQHLRRFYKVARPPGFWGGVCEPEGDSAQDVIRVFWSKLARTALAALSIFCFLSGIATWMLGSPAPAWFPSRWLWLALLMGTGVLTARYWAGAAFRPRAGETGPQS